MLKIRSETHMQKPVVLLQTQITLSTILVPLVNTLLWYFFYRHAAFSCITEYKRPLKFVHLYIQFVLPTSSLISQSEQRGHDLFSGQRILIILMIFCSHDLKKQLCYDVILHQYTSHCKRFFSSRNQCKMGRRRRGSTESWLHFLNCGGYWVQGSATRPSLTVTGLNRAAGCD